MILGISIQYSKKKRKKSKYSRFTQVIINGKNLSIHPCVPEGQGALGEAQFCSSDLSTQSGIPLHTLFRRMHL